MRNYELEGFSVEELPQLRSRREVDLYDPACLRLDTSIKAVWALYRRGRWNLLESIGLPRSRFETQFEQFDSRYITSDHGLLRTVDQVELFISVVPGVVLAGMILIELYKSIFSERVNT